MITVGEQISDMAEVYPDWSSDRLSQRTCVWVGHLQPHRTRYRLRVEYTEPLLVEGRSNLYLQPLVEVLEPTLERRFGNEEGSLPHVYVSHPRTTRTGPFLCLFDDEADQWSPDDRISDTAIPWASNWLSCYESWLATGKWFGTGKHVRGPSGGRGRLAALNERFHGTASIPALAGHHLSPSRTTRVARR